MESHTYRNVLLLVEELHKRGYEKLRICPGMSPSGIYWRCSITYAGLFSSRHGALISGGDPLVARYTSGQEASYFGWEDAAGDTVPQLADKFLERFPEICSKGKGKDEAYASWYVDMLRLTMPNGLPVAYDDYDLHEDCLPLIFYEHPDAKVNTPTCIPLPPLPPLVEAQGS